MFYLIGELWFKMLVGLISGMTSLTLGGYKGTY